MPAAAPGGRLHILMVLDAAQYPAKGGGGAEAQVRALCKGLRAIGHRVTVLVPRTRSGPQARVERIDGVPVYRLGYPRIRLIGGPLLWLRLASFLYSRRGRYDAWHIHVAHRLGAVATLMGRMLRTRTLIKVSGIWEVERGALSLHRGVLSAMTLRVLRQADGWQAISQSIVHRLQLVGIPGSRVVRIPNAVDTVRFGSVQPASERAVRLVFVGRLAAEKGLDTLLHAFADVAPEFPEAHLTLVGTGPLDAALKRIVHERCIEAQVSFGGYRSDIEAVMAQANVGVLSSLHEGLSNTLLETMASGLPMIASRISGNEDFVVDGENGWLFEPGDRAGLARCLRLACGLPATTRAVMGRRARETIERHASFERVLAALVAFYREGEGHAAQADAAAQRARV